MHTSEAGFISGKLLVVHHYSWTSSSIFTSKAGGANAIYTWSTEHCKRKTKTSLYHTFSKSVSSTRAWLSPVHCLPLGCGCCTWNQRNCTDLNHSCNNGVQRATNSAVEHDHLQKQKAAEQVSFIRPCFSARKQPSQAMFSYQLSETAPYPTGSALQVQQPLRAKSSSTPREVYKGFESA